MEKHDHELIQRFMKVDSQLRRLYQEHERFESELEPYKTRTFLTSAEQVKEKKLKRRKLSGVDQIMVILQRYRVSQEARA